MTPEQILAKSHRAERELVETQEIVAQLRAAIVQKWAETGIDAVDTREKLYAHYNALNAVMSALQASAASGLVERHSAEIASILAPVRR